MKERESQYRAELAKPSQPQVTLQEKEKEMNLARKQKLDELPKPKNEMEFQQRIEEYEQMLQQKNKQIEILTRNDQQGPALMRSVGDKYPMSKTPHGIAVIINNFEFRDHLPNRMGSLIDEENLRVTWEYLRYDVRIMRNLTASELID